MRTIKNQTPRLLLILGGAILFNNLPAYADEGAQLFQQHCSRCHRSADRIKTSPDELVTVLSSGTIRPHRFTLDDSTIQLIAEYIKQQK